MFLTYVDESYTKGKAWYYMVALLVPGRAAVSLTDALDQVVLNAAARFGVSTESELHGYEVFQAYKHWEPLAGMHRARIGVYTEAFHAITDHHVMIILRGVRAEHLKVRYSRPMDPHSVVLGHLLERINSYALEHNEYALVISDEVDGAAKHRADLSTYKAGGRSDIDHRRFRISWTPSISRRPTPAGWCRRPTSSCSSTTGYKVSPPATLAP